MVSAISDWLHEVAASHILADVLEQLDAAALAVQAGLEALEPAALDREIPAHQAGQTLTLRRSLLQIAAHLAYHLGQVNYHRRLAAQP